MNKKASYRHGYLSAFIKEASYAKHTVNNSILSGNLRKVVTSGTALSGGILGGATIREDDSRKAKILKVLGGTALGGMAVEVPRFAISKRINRHLDKYEAQELPYRRAQDAYRDAIDAGAEDSVIDPLREAADSAYTANRALGSTAEEAMENAVRRSDIYTVLATPAIPAAAMGTALGLHLGKRYNRR